MPADYQSTAQGLAVSPSRPSPSSPPPWARHGDAAGRLSHTSLRRGSAASLRQSSFVGRTYASARLLAEQVIKAYLRLSLLQRILVAIGALVGWAILILSIMYSHAVFSWLAPISKSWRARPGGWLAIFFLVFMTSFPPMIGYSTACTIAGFIYGFPLGWPIVASACTIGALAAFMASRTVLSGPVHRMVGKDHRFVALGQVLRHDGILYLTAIRFCPLPFSLSNGFLATIPSITPLSFALCTALSSPKLLIHIFIGSRLAILAEGGDSMTMKDRFINYLSMAIGGSIGIGVGLVIYRRTMARAEELAREEAMQAAAEEGDGGFEDSEITLMDPEDAAALMSDDDVSLWEANNDDYRDETDNDGQDDGKKQRTDSAGNADDAK